MLEEYQDDEGCWSSKRAIQRFVKCDIELEELDGRELYTVFAIALLSINKASSHASVRKAFMWLDELNPSYDWIKAVRNAEEKTRQSKK